MSTIRLPAAQAVVKWLANQHSKPGVPFIAGCWAIFGHGNVAGMGKELQAAGKALSTWRGQIEQTMAHAVITYTNQPVVLAR